MNGERKGVPSASGVERIHLCPGSWNLERGLPEGERSEDADSGTRVHDVWAGLASIDILSLEERETLDALQWLELQAIRTVFGGLDETAQVHREKRLWLHDEAGAPLFSGKLDFYVIQGDHALILDGKTGRNETERANGNMQLRAQAVLLDEFTRKTLKSITVGIVAPWQEDKLTLCRYEVDHLDAAQVELQEILDSAKDPLAPRIPSEKACRYCKAKAICPEAREAALSLPVKLGNGPELLPNTDDAARTLAALLTGDELSLCLGRGELFERIHTAIRGEARKRLMAGDRVPGWHLKPGRVNRPITDPALVFGRFLEIGGTQEQFMTTVEVGKGALQERVNAITKETGKALKNRMASILDGATQEKQSGAILERI